MPFVRPLCRHLQRPLSHLQVDLPSACISAFVHRERRLAGPRSLRCVTVGSTKYTPVSIIQVSDPEYSRKKGFSQHSIISAGPTPAENSGLRIVFEQSTNPDQVNSADCTPGAAQVPAQTCSGHTRTGPNSHGESYCRVLGRLPSQGTVYTWGLVRARFRRVPTQANPAGAGPPGPALACKSNRGRGRPGGQ